MSPGNKVLSSKPSHNPSKIESVCRLRLSGTSRDFLIDIASVSVVKMVQHGQGIGISRPGPKFKEREI